MIHDFHATVSIRITGDPSIDQYEGLSGKIVDVRTINERGCPSFEQVCIRFSTGDEVWVNENEYQVDW